MHLREDVQTRWPTPWDEFGDALHLLVCVDTLARSPAHGGDNMAVAGGGWASLGGGFGLALGVVPALDVILALTLILPLWHIQ